jgi:hypothetical protein
MPARILAVRVVILLAPPVARAHEAIRLFSQPNNRGQAYTLREFRESLNLHRILRSVRVRRQRRGQGFPLQ